MAYYDLEEQEQLDAIKAWWRQWGRLVIAVVVALAIGAAGFKGWTWYRDRQASAAADLYLSLSKAVEAGDATKSKELAEQLFTGFKNSTYAAFGALAAARASFDHGDLAGAATLLGWAVQNARAEELQDLARLRLAAVLLDQKEHAKALEQLDYKHIDGLAHLYLDLRGDVLMAEGKRKEAQAAFRAALEKTEARSPYRNLVQMKLDSLGDLQ